MKAKTPIVRSLVIITILILSLIMGFIISCIWGGIDKKTYPREYSDFVEKYSEEYAVPEYLIYAVIKTESSFSIGKTSDDGGIGLMGVDPDEFKEMQIITKEKLTDDALYGPETNIKYGTLRLSMLYNMFGNWKSVCSGQVVSLADAEKWTLDESCYDKNGKFINVPDDAAEELGEKLYKCAEKYRSMYY